MGQPGKFTHIFDRYKADADQWERVGTAVYLDADLYHTSRSHWEVAEEILATHHRDSGYPAGVYRVQVATFQGHLIIEVERPLPLPPEWAALPSWPDHSKGEIARAHAGILLAAYPGAGVELIGRHLKLFADHFAGKISTPELAEKTGYQLPPELPRPHGRNVDVPPENA